MTITAYSNAIMNAMLSWLKGLANWVLRLFNLAGTGGGSPLLWLSQHWLSLLILLMILGIALDLLVWLVRWRPHWVWLRKERVIVDDERFFNASDIRDKLEDDDTALKKNWGERDYVVASTVVRPRKSGGKGRSALNRQHASTRRDRRAYVRPEERRQGRGVSSQPDPFSTRRQRNAASDIASDARDTYEDEVFNVNNLPEIRDNS